MYLDTSDDVLRQRGIICRLRADADGNGKLLLHIAQHNGDGQRKYDIADAVGTADQNGAGGLHGSGRKLLISALATHSQPGNLS